MAPRVGHFMVASWRSNGGWTAAGEPWNLSGGTQALRTKFEWLAERAAIRLGHTGGRLAMYFWFDRLRAESANYRITGEQSSRDGEVVARSVVGGVDRVCDASADYCIKCASQQIMRQRGVAPTTASATAHATSARLKALTDKPVGGCESQAVVPGTSERERAELAIVNRIRKSGNQHIYRLMWL